MIENGTILENGTETFTPVINRMLEIAQECIPYIIFITISVIGINATIYIVKRIIKYLEQKTKIEREEKRNKYRQRRRQRNRDNYRRRLIEYAQHGYDIKDEREAHGYGKYHG